MCASILPLEVEGEGCCHVLIPEKQEFLQTELLPPFSLSKDEMRTGSQGNLGSGPNLPGIRGQGSSSRCRQGNTKQIENDRNSVAPGRDTIQKGHGDMAL